MTEEGTRVAVVFGGASVEHDVSIITGLQVMAVAGERHRVVPIYVATDGRWWTGESLRRVESFASQPPAGARPIELRLGRRPPFVEPSSGRFGKDREAEIDVVINAIHGTGGEDGTLLGALELCGLPYVGCGVAAAAVAMDKHLAKTVLSEAGLEVLPHRRVERSSWEDGPDRILDELLTRFGGDVVVKPMTLGSSVGVRRCFGREEMNDALDLALELDRQAIVEPFARDAKELNVAVLGRPGGELIVSEVERPLGSESGLSFEDKYLRGGKGKAGGSGSGSKGGGMVSQDRIIPADVPDEWREAVKRHAREAHRALRLAGVVRYDFFVMDDGERIILNEPNTVPGSFAFYLFEPAGIDFPALVEHLLEIAVAEYREERSTTRSFDSALLSRHIDA